MRKIFLSGLVALLAFSGCKDDFNVAAPYKQVTVVYGILGPLDTAHYIRIQKAFLDETKSAIVMSKVPDSSYFPEADINVKLIEYNLSNNAVISQTPLNRVNLADEGYPKDSAANNQGFFTSPSYAYKFKKSFNPNYGYRLIIAHTSGRVDSSQIVRTISSDTAKNTYGSFYVNEFSKQSYSLDFAKTTLPSHQVAILGKTPLNGVKLEGKLRFNYDDKNVVTNTTEKKHVDMYISSTLASYTDATPFQLTVPNKNIYSFLRDAMGTAPANVERYMGTCEMWVYAGNRELYTYQQINQAQTGGLTGDQIKPNYTNMMGTDVLGLVASSSYRYYDNAIINDNTLDSLKVNPLTQPLNIRGRR